MTDRAVDLGTLPAPPRRTAGDLLKALPAAPTACLVAFALAVALVTTPSLQIQGWRWILAGLGVLTATLLTWPLHRTTGSSLGAGHVGTAALGSITVLVSAAAAADAVVHDHQTSTSLAAIAVAFLTVSAVWVRGGTAFVESPGWFTAVAVIAAAIAAIAWWLARDTDAARDAATAVLMASGPGTLLIAGPLALIATRHEVRDDGITLPDPHAVLAAEDIDTVVLDKDGTVTTGELTVIAVDPVEPDHDRNLRWFAGALEHTSEHRIGRAIASLSGRGRVAHVEHLPGRGITGAVDRHPVRVGDPSWLGIPVVEGLWTTVGVEVDARSLGTITVADDVRPEAAGGVEALTAAGIDVVMVSRDNEARTRDIATRAGISGFHGEIDEASADRIVAGLTAEGRVVAFAGFWSRHARFDLDDLGLADRSVDRLARAVTCARRAVARARRARRVALGLGGLGIVVAATGLVAPWIAAALCAVGFGVVVAVSTAGTGRAPQELSRA